MNQAVLAPSHLFAMSRDRPVPAPELVALTVRMAAGDEAAFREFHDKYFPRLFRYVLVLMRGDEAAACDVTQEALLRVVRRVRRFEVEKVFWDWLTCLARSAAADHGRRTSRYRRALNFFVQESSPKHDLQPAPEEMLATALSHCLPRLNPSDRLLLERKYQGGESVRDLAAEFNVSESALESRLARARGHLRKLLFQVLRHADS